MKKILAKIRNDRSHASIPFWSWNDRLEETELRRQIRNLKDMGIRGFFMHARGGLETPYLSEEWFNSVRVCLDEAKKLDLEAWAYDENGWPSGFAGGALLDDPTNHAAGVVMEYTEQFPEESDDLLGVYLQDDAGVTRIETPNGATRYLVLRRIRDFSYVDILNPAVTAQFIEKTHEVYRRELGEDFGGVMPGFFTDEPQYFRWGTPWSDTFRTVFTQRFGYDVRDKLPALFLDFPGAEEFRYDYHLLLHECFINNFAKPIYEWCEAHGVQLTGHGIEEWGLGGQMICCGGVMPFYRYQHLPGIDYLGRDVKSIVGSKQLGSVCEQLGRTARLTETFACCGWDVTPQELKRIVDVQFVGGVNLICEHLYPYSERGQRKRDYPNHYSDHNPWQSEYNAFVDHYAHLGAALAEGRELANVLVIHPIRSAYLYHKHCDGSVVADLCGRFTELSTRLSFDQIPYHYGDETILREFGSVEGNELCVGRCRYDTVVIPYSYTLDASTVALLKDYMAGGGKLLLWDRRPDRIDGYHADLSFLQSTVTYEEIKAATSLSVTYGEEPVPLYLQGRVTDRGRLFFLANPSERVYRDVVITVKDCRGLVAVDPITMETSPLRGQRNADGSVTVMVDFGDSGSCLLAETESEYLPLEAGRETATMSLNSVMPLVGRPENTLLLDEAAMALDGVTFGSISPIEQLRDNLLAMRYEGDVTLRFHFSVETVPSSLILVAESMTYRRVAVNGHDVVLTKDNGRFDRSFVGADIAPYVSCGENEVTLTFAYHQSEHVYDVMFGGGTEARRNCLAFDTEVENIYLYGDFTVKPRSGYVNGEKPNTYRGIGPYVICAPTDRVDMSDVVRSGFPFFAGKMTVENHLSYRSGDPTLLSLRGRFAVCKAEVNGVAVDSNLFTRDFELASYLRDGDNTLRLTVFFSNRNLFGPHHRRDPEPTDVGPQTFSFEKEWNGDQCQGFVKDKAFVRFGIM